MRSVSLSLAAQWRERFTQFTESGQSARIWCDEQGIPEHQFHYWRRKISSSAARTSAPKWVEFQVRDSAASSDSISPTITVRIGDAAIDVASGFSPDLLQAVIAAVRGASC